MEITELNRVEERMVGYLAALAHDTRLSIFRLLVRAGRSGLAAGTISDRLGLPPSSLSFHVANLRNAGLVTDERAGRSILYRANLAAMTSLVLYLSENCCADEPNGTRDPKS